jgi:hypothetical protein
VTAALRTGAPRECRVPAEDRESRRLTRRRPVSYSPSVGHQVEPKCHSKNGIIRHCRPVQLGRRGQAMMTFHYLAVRHDRDGVG